MKKLIKDNLSFVVRFSIILFFLIFLICLLILQTNVYFAEMWTTTVSRFYQTAVGSIFKYLPFSVTELVFAELITTTIVFIIYLIKNFVTKRYKEGFSITTNLVLIYVVFIFTYVSTTSIAYYRAPLEIELYEENVDKSEFRPIIEHFLNDFNYCSNELGFNEDGSVKMPYSPNELSRVIEKEYSKIDNPYFSSFTTYSKPMISSFLYVEFQITGVYFGSLGESNYDKYMTSAEFPFTFAHEIAHSKGVMRENDAQIVAAYICLNSDDIYLRYSGYIYTFNSLLQLAKYTGNKNDYKELYNMMNPKILDNYDQISEYWKKHDFLSDFAEFWNNNLYLKIFGSESTDEYEDKPPVVNPDTNEITSFSKYQKLYFKAYFDKNN